MYDVIIVGGGPAGITAGIYAARKGLKGLLITKDFLGQLGNAGIIENWPGEKSILGPELIDKFESHLRDYQIEVKEEKVALITKRENFFEVKSENEIYKSKAVIAATGRKPRPLEVPGEKEYIGKGVSYCVTCDGALFRDKTVVVVGGGNAGLEGALELSEYAKKVYLIEISDTLRADESLVERAKNRNNVFVLTKAKIERIIGDDFVKEIEIKNLSDNGIKKIETAGVFVEIGSIPITEILNDLVDYNKYKEVLVNQKCETKTEGLYAAGDLTDIRDKQIVVATAEGCKALLSCYDYLKNKKI